MIKKSTFTKLFALLLPIVFFLPQTHANDCRIVLFEGREETVEIPAPQKSEKLGGHFTEKEVDKIIERFSRFVRTKKQLPGPLDYGRILPMDAEFDPSTDSSFGHQALLLAFNAYPELEGELKSHLAKIVIEQMSGELRAPETSRVSEMFGLTEKQFVDLFGSTNDLFNWVISEDIPATEKPRASLEKLRSSILTGFAKLMRELGRTPTAEELFTQLTGGQRSFQPENTEPQQFLALLGESKNSKLALFDGLQDLYQQVVSHPDNEGSFSRVLPEKYNHEHNTRIANLIKKHPRMILTAAAPGVPLHEEAFEALKTFAKEKDAVIVIMAEANHPFYLDEQIVDKEAEGIYILTQSIELSPWLRINDMPLNFKRADPLSGLRQAGMGGARGQSQIVFHSQQRDEVIPTINNHILPHRLVSTGAITQGLYNSRYLIGGVTDQMARERHTLGFVLVEKEAPQRRNGSDEPSGLFHTRHVTYSEDLEGFVDMGQLFTSKQVEEQHPRAVVPGDLHLGVENERLVENLLDYVESAQPDYIVLHDIFNGDAINHHEAGRPLTRAQKAQRGQLDLVDELNLVPKFINRLLDSNPKMEVVIPAANHNEWLMRWLQNITQNANSPHYQLALELQYQYVKKGKDPLAYYTLEYPQEVLSSEEPNHLRDRLIPVSDPTRVKFLARGESFTIGNTELSLHGDMGPNGSRGSTQNLAKAVDFAVIGHTHSPARIGGVVNVGTMTEIPLDYAVGGPSSWANAFAVVYDGNIVQLHHFNSGSGYFANTTDRSTSNARIFPEGYPKAIERPTGESDVDTLDQWRDFHGVAKKK